MRVVAAELPGHRHAGELGDRPRELVGRLAVGDDDARAAPGAEPGERDAGLGEADDDDGLAGELGVGVRRHRSFRVPSASSANRSDTSQNRTMILGSSQPFFS